MFENGFSLESIFSKTSYDSHHLNDYIWQHFYGETHPENLVALSKKVPIISNGNNTAKVNTKNKNKILTEKQ